MNSVNFEQSPDRECSTIPLDMTNFMQKLSNKSIYRKTEVRNEDVQKYPKVIDCKTEDCTSLCEISSGMGFEQNKTVREVNIEFVVFYHKRLILF